MSDKRFLQIKAAVYEMSLLFNQQPTDERITAYANALRNYEPKQIIFAFKKVISSGSAFFPSLAEILKHLRPAEANTLDRAPEIVAEMLKALRWYGPHDEKRMLENVSEEAKLAFMRLGHTADIRNSENTDMIRAQLERLVKSVMTTRQIQQKNKELLSIGIDAGNVLALKKPEMKKMSFDDFGPEIA